MDPRWLLPLLALVFALLAVGQAWRRKSWSGASRAWGLIAVIFALVSWWLRAMG